MDTRKTVFVYTFLIGKINGGCREWNGGEWGSGNLKCLLKIIWAKFIHSFSKHF